MITVDKKTFRSKAKALNFFLNAMLACDGSEQQRMTFAYCAIAEGKTNIDTYRETADSFIEP